MAKCPKCGKKITYLKDWAPCWEEYHLTVEKNDCGNFVPQDNYEPMEAGEAILDRYVCPECNIELTRSTKEAIQILKD